LGRDARARRAGAPKKKTRVTLPPEQFWKFRAKVKDLETLQLEAVQAIQQLQAKVHTADAECRALFRDLGKAHGFNPDLTWGWNDETCELVQKPAGKKGQPS